MAFIGRKHSKKSKKIMSLKKQRENHYNWKGENVPYCVKHMWLHYNFGSANKCENPDCVYPRKNAKNKIMLKPSRYEWSNISGKYLRDRNDYIQLCPSCHRLKDKKHRGE